jgi:hypothetical protein
MKRHLGTIRHGHRKRLPRRRRRVARMTRPSVARQFRSVFFAFLAGILPGLYVWTQLLGPPEEAQGAFGMVLLVYFVLGGFLGYLGRAPFLVTTTAMLLPVIALLSLHAWQMPEDGRTLPILGVIILIAYGSAWGGKRYRRPRGPETTQEPEGSSFDEEDPFIVVEEGQGSDVDASRHEDDVDVGDTSDPDRP